jgi:hypothetical protein
LEARPRGALRRCDVNTTLQFDDLAERIGRFATEEMLVRDPFERSQIATAGLLAVCTTLDAVRDFFDAKDAEQFVDGLRTALARHEEMAA